VAEIVLLNGIVELFLFSKRTSSKSIVLNEYGEPSNARGVLRRAAATNEVDPKDRRGESRHNWAAICNPPVISGSFSQQLLQIIVKQSQPGKSIQLELAYAGVANSSWCGTPVGTCVGNTDQIGEHVPRFFRTCISAKNVIRNTFIFYKSLEPNRRVTRTD
jgi:hypothetical protein